MKRALVVFLVTSATIAGGCSSDGSDAGSPDSMGRTGTTATATPTTAMTTTTMATAVPVESSAVSSVDAAPQVGAPELRAELLAMMDEDQAEQTGQVATNNYAARTERLGQILDEYGWPTIELVGEDGSTAAWVIAQHADLDPELQQRALDLLRSAAESGQASRGDLAYLEDRVAVAAGSDQSYGTQMGCVDGMPLPATPIADESTVEQRRAEAGLAPLAEYIEEMTVICAEVE